MPGSLDGHTQRWHLVQLLAISGLQPGDDLVYDCYPATLIPRVYCPCTFGCPRVLLV